MDEETYVKRYKALPRLKIKTTAIQNTEKKTLKMATFTDINKEAAIENKVQENSPPSQISAESIELDDKVDKSKE